MGLYFTTTKIVLIVKVLLISLLLAGCSVFNDDDYIEDKPWNTPASWENQGFNLPAGF